MTDITMPRLTDSTEEATILRWLVDDGAPVAEGQDLVELEADKVTVTHPAEAAGVLEIVAAEGATPRVGEVIARVDPGVARPAGDAAHDDAPRATPLARRVAAAHAVELAAVNGTGPRGRITRRDVLAAAGAPAEAAAPAAPGERRELSSLQRVVARRMVESRSVVPDFQVQTEVTMDAAIALRAQLKAAAADGDGVPSLTDLVIAAAARALREHPLANGSYDDGHVQLHDRVNVGVAVAAPGALVVPTVFDADTKSLGQIALETRRLAARVRAGEIAPQELSGGTFTVSSLGMYGMTAITPVINPPQAAIVGVGALREVLARVEGEIVDRTLMTLTLSCDHRILYGADAAAFLTAIRERLEAPLRLAL